MIKSYAAIIFFFIMTVLIMLVLNVEKSKKRDAQDIAVQLKLGIVLNAVHLVGFFSEEETLLQMLYSVELIMESWILYYFVRFACGFKQGIKKKKSIWNDLSVIALCINSVLLLINAFTEFMFPIQIHEWDGAIYVGAMLTIGYVFELVIIAVCELMMVVIMLRKALRVANVYRLKYSISSIGFAAIYVVEVISRIILKHSNAMPIIVISLGVGVYYYIYYRRPQTRISRMKNYAINKMADPVLMFDLNDSLQVFNSAAREVLGVEEFMMFDEFIAANALNYELKHLKSKERVTSEFTRTTTVGRKTYLIHGQELWDSRKKFVGTLLVYMDITGQEKLKDEATLYATRDPLTGLWNRDYFFEMVDKTVRENPDEEFVMIVSDVYQFKIFNEILGTKAGDDLLLAIAQGYRERCKRLWTFSRIAGDRFALFMPKSDFHEERFISFCHDVFSRKNFSLKVHFYLGVYEVRDRSVAAKHMYDRAYMALECIKGDLRKEIAYYYDEILNRRIFEITTVDEMDRALLNDEFVIFLQPQVDISTRKIVSCEALIRWKKPNRGIVSPGEFIPLFESNGMIAKLDYYVWELACKQLRTWKEAGHEERSISVNISAKDFYLTDLYESLTALVEKYDISPRNLKLEITETAFVLDVRKQMELVRKLQAYGFLIEIDDFGSGYSSLNSLKDICVDILKMDLKFFEKTDQSDRAEKIVESVIALANSLGMPVIAEGVETKEHLDMLRAAGCQMIQGYYFAKPMSVEDYEEFVKDYTFEDMEEILRQVRK